MMYRIEQHHALDEPWDAMEPIRVGPVPTGVAAPGLYVTVEQNGRPLARIDVWPVRQGPFTELVVWKQFVVVGWCDHVHLVEPVTRDVRSIECDGYFGHIYPVDDYLLIADASKLTCLKDRGERLWQSDVVGIDGVIVDDVCNDQIDGRGEWDPPGGWKPFRLSLQSGQLMAK